MNTFKRFLVVLAMMGGTLFVATAPAEAARVPAKVCAQKWTYNHLSSWTARKCKRQGWFYDVGRYTEMDGSVVKWALVVGPRGRVWVDTLGQLGNVR